LFEKFGHAGYFRFGGFPAERCEPVVAAALVVVAVFGALRIAQFDDQAIFEESLDCAIESASAKAEFAGGADNDVLHDAVAVLIPVGEGDQDVKGLRGEGGHENSISHVGIVMGDRGGVVPD
jgi:hypothetical protein